MLNEINDDEENTEINLKEVDLNEERTLFEIELKKSNTKDDISLHYDSITEDKILSWESQLIDPKIHNYEVDDCDILNHKLNDKNVIRVIKDDIERTRVLESLYMKSFKEYVYQIIIYYLNHYNIAYKQGFNEVVSPFVLLKYKFSLSISRIYKLIDGFIYKFLTNFYHEYEFYSIKSCFALINLLLKYHDPELYDKFDYCLITPDLFCTSWIITLFSNKFPLNIIYYLWDKLILFKDTLFIFFFIVSILITNRELYFKVDSTSILFVLSKFEITEIKQINDIINLAIQLRENTPKSFDLLVKKLEIFEPGSKNLQKLYEEIKPEKMLALPMFVEDVFFVTHDTMIGCTNENCECFLKKNKKFNRDCIFCNDRKLNKIKYYIVLDLRIINEIILKNKLYNELFSGTLPKTYKISNEELMNEIFPENVLNSMKNDKNRYYIIIVTSETDLFNEYEDKFYVLEKLKNSRVEVFYKRYKELNTELVNETFIEKKSQDYFLFKEYDNFKKIVNGMIKQGFKYVSFAYGGYKQLHAWGMKHNLLLLSHGKECLLCREEKEKEKETESTIFKFWEFSFL